MQSDDYLRLFICLPGKVSVTLSVELVIGCSLEHMTVAPERSVDLLVVIVEVSGDIDVRLNVYTTPVPWLVGLNFLPIESPRKNVTLFISDPLKKSISQRRAVDDESVTIQVKVAWGSEQTSSLRIGMPITDYSWSCMHGQHHIIVYQPVINSVSCMYIPDTVDRTTRITRVTFFMLSNSFKAILLVEQAIIKP